MTGGLDVGSHWSSFISGETLGEKEALGIAEQVRSDELRGPGTRESAWYAGGKGAGWQTQE